MEFEQKYGRKWEKIPRKMNPPSKNQLTATYKLAVYDFFYPFKKIIKENSFYPTIFVEIYFKYRFRQYKIKL
ncbi:hypothetical protein CLV48_103138 [Cecembia rubra]|uniref:Uncharacterized protein n=1 Tax=Cecembia rubra TaxID=1485585 RepID=A0A2P8E816_9BACT|nr:hypothetical protein CLV48_103138 [Cecembia rubra]